MIICYLLIADCFVLVKDKSSKKGSYNTDNHHGKSLVLYFGFHDVSGNDVHDGSGRNNNGILSKGTPTICFIRFTLYFHYSTCSKFFAITVPPSLNLKYLHSSFSSFLAFYS